MNLYKITQGEFIGYDTYDSAVVAAPSHEAARKIHPSPYVTTDDWKNRDNWASSPDNVTAEYIGKAAAGTEAGVILASFNAG